jgi:hypothetical protein
MYQHEKIDYIEMRAKDFGATKAFLAKCSAGNLKTQDLTT